LAASRFWLSETPAATNLMWVSRGGLGDSAKIAAARTIAASTHPPAPPRPAADAHSPPSLVYPTSPSTGAAGSSTTTPPLTLIGSRNRTPRNRAAGAGPVQARMSPPHLRTADRITREARA